MNNYDHGKIDSRELDRLVDGELTTDEYRNLLVSLDDQPNGWRQCALAFLEAQAWKQAAQKPILTVDRFNEGEDANLHVRSGRSNMAPIPTDRIPRNPTSGRFMFAASAASFLLAFALGIGVQRFMESRTNHSSGLFPIAQNQIGSHATNRDGSANDNLTALVQTGSDESMEGDAFRGLAIPVYHMDDHQALGSLLQEFHLPRDVRRSLERLGYDISEQRRIAPIQLLDGSPGIVPIDEVRITPVSRQSF